MRLHIIDSEISFNLFVSEPIVNFWQTSKMLVTNSLFFSKKKCSSLPSENPLGKSVTMYFKFYHSFLSVCFYNTENKIKESNKTTTNINNHYCASVCIVSHGTH